MDRVRRPPGAIYFPTLDGLRFFAFLLVFLHHLPRAELPVLGFLHDNGWVGVHIFLALSAYLLTAILRSEHARNRAISIGRFYARRCLRIWPLYFAFCGVVTVFAVSRHSLSENSLFRLGTLVVFVDNVATGFKGYNPLPHTGHLWTISLEEQFYLVLPFLLRRWLGNTNVLMRGLLAIWFGFVAVRVLCVLNGATHPLIWTSVFSADSLLLGTAMGATGWRPRLAPVGRTAIVVGGIIGIFSGGFLPRIEQVGFHQVIVYSTVGLGAGLLALAALTEPLLAFLGVPALRYLGKISYGLYVFHIAGLSIGTRLIARVAPGQWWLVATASFVVTLVLSIVSYELFEKKFLLLKRRFETIHTRPV